MNYEQLKRNLGYRVKLVPPACPLDAEGNPLIITDEDWTLMAVLKDAVEINTDQGLFYRLGKDHVHSFLSDRHRSMDAQNYGFLKLHVQLYIQGGQVRAVPNHQPGASVLPQPDPALKARATFIPELERVFRRQVHVLDRVLVNFSATANRLVGTGHAELPGDTWDSLTPVLPRLFPSTPASRDLSASDVERFAEFYAAVDEVADLIARWTGTMALTEYNAWNVLMHKVQNSLRLGELAVQRFCPDRPYDATMPAGGSLLAQSQRVLMAADNARHVVMGRLQAAAQQAGQLRRMGNQIPRR